MISAFFTIATTSDIFSVTTIIFNDAYKIIVLAIGIPLVFYIIEKIIDMTRQKYEEKRTHEETDKYLFM